jgi:hypothetical protein
MKVGILPIVPTRQELTRIIHKVPKRRDVVGKAKVKYQVKRIFIRHSLFSILRF